jgi:hypothetical protein
MAVSSSVPKSTETSTAQLGAWPAPEPSPVCDPQMPLAYRRWAVRQRPVFSSRGELAVLMPGGSSGGTRPVTACSWLLAVVCMILLVIDPAAIGRGGWAAAAAASAIAAAAIQHGSRRRDLQLCRAKVIFPESLDETCRALLVRGQRAIAAVAGSDVRAAGLLAHPVQDMALHQHEWEIAGKLREITSFRALLAETTLGTPAGPMTTDVLTAQQRAIELAQQAAAARIAALERYARQVTAADDADRDWQQAVKLSRLNDRYLDLIARTAADQYAAGQIADLTEQLTAAARARNARLYEADLAAEVLVLPAVPAQTLHQGDIA